MNRRVVASVLGLALLAVALALGISRATAQTEWPVAVVVVAGLLAAGWQLYRRRSERSEAPTRTRELPPERTPDDYPLSGANLSSILADAEAAARADDDIASGLAVARPMLRHTLTEVLRASGDDERRIESLLASGDWTGEPAAAATIDPAVPLPELTRRERLFAWLFPERFVRAYVRATVSEIGAVADSELPTVPGQQAPRPVPVRQPSLARLREGPDGEPRIAGDEGESASITDGRAAHEYLGAVDDEEGSP